MSVLSDIHDEIGDAVILIIASVYLTYFILDIIVLSDEGGKMLFDRERAATFAAVSQTMNITASPYHNPNPQDLSHSAAANAFISISLIGDFLSVLPLIIYAISLAIRGIRKTISEWKLNVPFLLTMGIYFIPCILRPMRNQAFQEVGKFFGYYDAYVLICANHTALEGCDRVSDENLQFEKFLDTMSTPGTLSTSELYPLARTLNAAFGLLLAYGVTVYITKRQLQAEQALRERQAPLSLSLRKESQ